MTAKRFIHVGTGGWGRYWSRTVIPHLLELGVAEPVAAVDVNPANLANAREGYGIAADRCYTDPVRAFAEQEADFAIVVVPPAHHEAIVDLALDAGCDILSEKPVADTMASSARIFLKVTQRSEDGDHHEPPLRPGQADPRAARPVGCLRAGQLHRRTAGA